MRHAHFADIRCWVFDLDNTLYPPEVRLFGQIEVRMTNWVMRALGLDRDAADRLRQDYWETYGTTLAGLIAEHDIDPAPYLDEVHDIDLSPLKPDPVLGCAIGALPGRKIVFTNSATRYADNVIAALGLGEVFDAVYATEHTRFHSKPGDEAFAAVIRHERADPARSAIFEDDPRNLEVPFALGMRTVHVSDRPASGIHIHHHTNDLPGFLASIVEGPR